MCVNSPQFDTNMTGVQALLNFCVPIDYKEILGTNRVVYFGEHHWQQATIQEMTRLIGDLRNTGFTHLALEAFSTRYQRFLDGMRTGSIPRSSAEYHCSDAELPYLNLVEVALQGGLTVIGISLPNGMPLSCIPEEELDTRFNWKRFEELYERAERKDPLLRHKFFRDCYAFKVLEEKAFTSPMARVAVFGGANHYLYSPDELRHRTTLNYLVENLLGISGCITYLVSNEPPSEESTGGYIAPLMELIPKATREARRETERFMIRTRDRVNGTRPDYVVHI